MTQGWSEAIETAISHKKTVLFFDEFHLGLLSLIMSFRLDGEDFGGEVCLKSGIKMDCSSLARCYIDAF